MPTKNIGSLTSLISGVILCFSLLFVGCGSGTKQETQKKEAETKKQEATKIEQVRTRRYFLVSDLIQGRKVFEDNNCSGCHSIFGKEEKPGPNLDTSGFRGSFLDIFSTLWNHAPAMAVQMRKEGLPRPSFSIPDLNQLVSFLYMLPYLSEPGNAARGESVLREKLCFTCHLLGNTGKPGGIPLDSLTPYQSQVILLQRMWNHGPVMISQMIATGTPVPTFSGKEIQDLFAALSKDTGEKEGKKIFLGVGDANKGRKLFAEKACVTCHAVYGTGGKQAPDLGETISQSSVSDLTALLWNHAADMDQEFRKKGLSWPYFSEKEISDLIVFLYSLNYIDKPGDPARGKAVFEEKNCADCHFESEGDMEKFLRTISPDNEIQFASQLWNHLPTMESTMVSQAVSWPELSGQDLRDILAFLRSQ